MSYLSTKVIKGFSCCFRQFAATHSHCSKLHGYAVKFKVTFEANTLDDKNWVVDFGFLKNSTFKFDGLQIGEWFKYMFDHTIIVSREDPMLPLLNQLEKVGIADIRQLDRVGCESFAELVCVVLMLMLGHENKDGRVWVKSVECIETEDNSAIFNNIT